MQGNPYQFGEQQYQSAPYYAPQPSNGNRGLIIALVAGLVTLLLLLVGTLAFLTGSNGLSFTSGNGDDTPVTVVETQTMTRSNQPEAAQPVPVANQGCPYSNYAPATSKTSGPFAANVYSAFRDACANTGGPNVNINVYSPVTGSTYSMSCSGTGTVYCRGGNNAVVSIW
ncbi:hypothetical protein [Corynebacterium sp. LK2510]|uniref:hypothetical protein n=1 Tax=Corynebacterium sp. LK2510 TaxID=3110472 RepID=UPI0034CE9146